MEWIPIKTDCTFLILTFSVVASGSSLAYAKKRGASLSTLRPCVRSDERKDAMTQGRKDWKPQNPSESGTFVYVVAPAPAVYVVTPLSAILGYDRMGHVEIVHWHCMREFIINLYTMINIITKGIY